MSTHYVNLRGCDDETVIDIDLTPEQFEFMQRLAEMSVSASTFTCMPTLSVHEAPKENTQP